MKFTLLGLALVAVAQGDSRCTYSATDCGGTAVCEDMPPGTCVSAGPGDGPFKITYPQSLWHAHPLKMGAPAHLSVLPGARRPVRDSEAAPPHEANGGLVNDW